MATTINQTHVLYEEEKAITNYGINGKVRVELRVTTTQYPEENRSVVNAYLYAIVGASAKSDGSTGSVRIESGRWGNINPVECYLAEGYSSYYAEGYYYGFREYLSFGSEKEYLMSKVENFSIYHRLDGALGNLIFTDDFRGVWFGNENETQTIFGFRNHGQSSIYELTFTIPNIDRAVYPTTANNFTDMENPAFNYTIPTTGKSQVEVVFSSGTHYWYVNNDTIVSLQAAISFDGSTPDIAYRNIPLDSTYYAFSLTEAEREVLRKKSNTAVNTPIYYLIKVVRGHTRSDAITPQASSISKTQRVLTIVGCKPTLNPTVKDVNSDTLALTGNQNYFVRYESMAEFSTGATASKYATIVSQSVQCGSKTVNNLYNGVIDDVESASFIFNASDSRGLHADQVVVGATEIPYIKPTCKQELEITMTSETGMAITLKASGNFFNGSFGKVANTIALEERHTLPSGSMSDWTPISGTPTYNGNTYQLSATFSGFTYEKGYTFQCRATDKLNVVETAQYTIRHLPVFDWSEEDFNFNVPVNMDGETVLRHGADTNNTVLSASGGHIYLRPGGTSSTSGETIIYPDGKVKFGGAVDFGNSFTIGGNTLADYVIESGTASMGSNGTWYWHKWASGKAECWGCRNFGNMAVTTAWGNLYRSNVFSQALPDKLFKTTPDVINLNIVNGNYGGWICKHENNAPSAVTTGSYIWVRPASATISPTYIGFHVIGLWK